jgi:branched-chain amino acid transport system substrate-binding protein
MKRFFIPFFAFFLLTLVADLGFPEPSLKVGALVPLMGRWGDSGRECAKGLLDAGRWINHGGGIYGRKMEILLMEDTSQPLETIAAFRKLNEADHISLLYIHSTETALALHPHIQFNRVPTLVSFLPSELANPSKYPYVFTATPTVLDSAKIGIHFISDKSGIKTRRPKMVFVGTPIQLDRHFLGEAKLYAKESGIDIGPDVWISDLPSSRESAFEEKFSKNISAALATILSTEPDFAYLSLTSRESLFLLQEAKRIGLKTRWIGNRKAFDETLSPFDGVFGVQPVAPYGEDVPGMVGIKEAHQKWHPFDSHTLSYVEGWATSEVVSEALGRSLPEQKLSRERVRLSLESFKHLVLGGLLPPITITPTDHRPSVESRIFTIRDQKLDRYTSFISVGR